MTEWPTGAEARAFDLCLGRAPAHEKGPALAGPFGAAMIREVAVYGLDRLWALSVVMLSVDEPGVPLPSASGCWETTLPSASRQVIR